MSEDVLYALRVSNVLLGLVAIAWLGARTWFRRADYPPIVRLFILTALSYALAVTAAQIITIVEADDEIPDGLLFIRASLFLMANTTLLITIALSQPKREVAVRHREHP